MKKPLWLEYKDSNGLMECLNLKAVVIKSIVPASNNNRCFIYFEDNTFVDCFGSSSEEMKEKIDKLYSTAEGDLKEENKNLDPRYKCSLCGDIPKLINLIDSARGKWQCQKCTSINDLFMGYTND